MRALAEQQAAWREERRRIARGLKVMVVEGDAPSRRALEELLGRAQIPASGLSSGAAALERLAAEPHGLLLVAERLPGMRGRALVRQARVSRPTVDIVLTSWEPTVALVREACALRALDLLRKPVAAPAEVVDRLRAALRRSVDRRMRTFVLNDLRRSLGELGPAARLRATAGLEARLSAYKSALGSMERVLVVEGRQGRIRPLADRLLGVQHRPGHDP